ncbi:Velvet domain-containing protein [Mycena sanguinolenta]|uniref:Velvet domain-containing protein n=1 Tax=Mycena sanguinolenta TaxID=230812 RepID=A0A8H6XLP0_9AGAR|nr:Velvet domain-containing protein [Mycena sanguinolenta]
MSSLFNNLLRGQDESATSGAQCCGLREGILWVSFCACTAMAVMSPAAALSNIPVHSRSPSPVLTIMMPRQSALAEKKPHDMRCIHIAIETLGLFLLAVHYISALPGWITTPLRRLLCRSLKGHRKQQTPLVGTTFVQVDSIPWKGRTCLLFAFADLAVKTEGYFIMQYRFFDLFSRPTGHTNQPILADCFGAPFRIYSSKEVLPPTKSGTDLTKHLARYGVRVNVRETEQKRKKKERGPSISPPYTTRRVEDIGAMFSDGTDDDD